MKGCFGSINVLNKPFESTTTTVAESSPSAPAILDLTLDMLNNIMIINPPKKVETQEEFLMNVNASKNINPLDIDFLDEDLLQDEFEEDLLEYTELDINYLDVELLEDLLDSFDSLGEEMLQEKQSSGELNLQGTEEGFDTVTQVATVIEGDKVTFNRTVNDIAVVTVDKNALTSLLIEQDGKELDPIRVNGVETEIVIKQ